MYVAVWHRNHLGILSEWHLNNNGNNLFSYYFASDSSQVYGGTLGHKELAPGIWGLASGDADANGFINFLDKELWSANAGMDDYTPGDFNFDSEVDNQDKSVWERNKSYATQVPE